MLNNLLLRKDMCHWSRGMQIRYNLTQLEEWCRRNGLQDSGAIEALEPIVQATQLLQVSKKAQSDVAGIFEMCTALNPLQVRLTRKHVSLEDMDITMEERMRILIFATMECKNSE